LWSSCNTRSNSDFGNNQFSRDFKDFVTRGDGAIELQFNFSGMLVFAAPHALGENKASLEKKFGAKLAGNMYKVEGLADATLILLVKDERVSDVVRVPRLLIGSEGVRFVRFKTGERVHIKIEDNVVTFPELHK